MMSDCIYRRKCGAQRPDTERRSGGYQPTGWSDASSIPPPPTTDSVVTYGGKRMNGHTKIETAKTIICNMCNEFHSDQPCEPSECEWMQRLEEDADAPAPKWTNCQRRTSVFWHISRIWRVRIVKFKSQKAGHSTNSSLIGCRYQIRQKGKRSGAANDDWMCKRDDVQSTVPILRVRESQKKNRR